MLQNNATLDLITASLIYFEYVGVVVDHKTK